MFDDIGTFLSDLLQGGGDAINQAAESVDWGGLSGIDNWFGGEEAAQRALPAASAYDAPSWGRDTLSAMGQANDTNVLARPRGGDIWNDTKGWLSRLADGDKTTMNQARFGLGGLGMLGSLLQSQKSRNQLSPAQLQKMLQSKYTNWTPGQQASFNNYFYKPLPKLQPMPQQFASGGQPVVGSRTPLPQGRGSGALSPEAVRAAIARAAAQAASAPPPQLPRSTQMMPRQRLEELERQGLAHGGQPCMKCGGLQAYAEGGSTGVNYVEGPTEGQADKVDARLSHGEYVLDADVVSSLGDGNNAAGAKKLDQMRQHIRAHKRSAPVHKIPPKAKSPLAYMQKVK